jgi:membrane protein DedA with SNARE-associated domain
VIRWWLGLPICVVGVLSGDVVLYWVGHHWGNHVLNWGPVRRVLTPERARALAERYHRHGVKLVFAARHVTGLRAPAFLMAGTVRIPFWKFLAVDAGAALIGVPAGFGLAYFLTDHLAQIMVGIHRIERRLAVIAVLIGVIVAGIVIRRRSRMLLSPENRTPPAA